MDMNRHELQGGYVAVAADRIWTITRAEDGEQVLRFGTINIKTEDFLETRMALQFIMNIFDAGKLACMA